MEEHQTQQSTAALSGRRGVGHIVGAGDEKRTQVRRHRDAMIEQQHESKPLQMLTDRGRKCDLLDVIAFEPPGHVDQRNLGHIKRRNSS